MHYLPKILLIAFPPQIVEGLYCSLNNFFLHLLGQCWESAGMSDGPVLYTVSPIRSTTMEGRSVILNKNANNGEIGRRRTNTIGSDKWTPTQLPFVIYNWASRWQPWNAQLPTKVIQESNTTPPCTRPHSAHIDLTPFLAFPLLP